MAETKNPEMPFWLKLNMTIPEAAEYSSIGINTLREIIEKDSTLPFILHVGKKKLIKRNEFEKWNSANFIVK